ncbi:Disease resistance protein RGA2 [Triticum urartu]|uniref:Disease resistance protein RGA2 n=1 Tax=Triticum urartu TaxID=4572 RepID=M7YM50_TRIUA|nr:Disease resistance protein RGA2 [Triticum urartu]
MSGLLGTVVDAAIGWLVESILGSFFTGQMEAWTHEIGLAEDVEKLKFEMRGRRIDNMPLAQSLADLKELLYDSEDVMDELDYYRLQQQIEKGKGCSAPTGTKPEESYVSSSPLSSVVKLVRSTTSQITDWISRGRKRKREEEGPAHCNMLPFEMKDSISKRINVIVNLLRSNGNSVQGALQLEILRPIATSMVGIGGIGKTTLARYVYHDKRIKDHFDLQMWVCVSTNFDIVGLTIQILEHEILLENIRNKRFLLVLDDMWEDKDRSGWIKLLAPLKSNQANGCMVLATTRTKSVAKMIGTMGEITLSGLDEKEFWLFFKACAFRNVNCRHHPSLQFIGKQIAKVLKGCPLAARSVGALLSTDVSYQHWTAVRDKWKSLQEYDDDILPILKLSYDHLPVHLQRCFSYCSLFPEDYQFNGKELVHAWISQNFVQRKDPTIRLEETGHAYLERLVDLGFFQKDGSHYIMHDLMHVLAGTVSANECATIDGLKSESIQATVRHLSIITTNFEEDEHGNNSSEKFDKILQKVSSWHKLRTLMLFGQSSIHLLGSLRTFCKRAKCLRFLSVSGVDIGSTNSLLNLFHLRYIMAYEVNNPAFRQALTSCYHLQVLDVGISGYLDVPADMNNLVNLRHLIAHEKVHHAIDCVGNMTSLQELKFKVQNVGGFQIGQLQSMNKLVLLGISQLENAKTKEEARGARLIDKEYLDKLSLSWENSSMNLQPEAAKDVLDGLQPHQNLKNLEITGYGGVTSPTWLSSTFSVTSLQILHLENCREWKILRSIEMPSLRKLTLIRMLNIMEISVPSLEELILIEMPKLEKCIGSYGMELTSHLRVLMIKNCPQLNEFTLFKSYSSFEAEQKSWFPSLSKLSIGQCPHIMNNWEILPLREMEALKELELMDLHVVRVILAFDNLRGITSLEIKNCQNLVSLSSEFNQLFALEHLSIHDCHIFTKSNIMSEIAQENSTPACSLVLPSLKSVNIKSCGVTGRWLTQMVSHSKSLENLQLRNCPQIKFLSIGQPREAEGTSSLAYAVMTSAQDEQELKLPYNLVCSLKKLWIKESWDLEFCGGKRDFAGFTSLTELVLQGCPKLVSSLVGETKDDGAMEVGLLPPSLEDLSITSLPENLHSFTPQGLLHLKKLSLRDGPCLKSVQLHSCTALKQLEITGRVGLAVLEGFQFLSSLRSLAMEMNPELSCAWVVELQEQEQCSNQIQLLPPSLEELYIWNLTDRVQSHLLSCLSAMASLAIQKSPELTSLQLGCCTAVKELEIGDCDLLASIEGLQFCVNLTSLKVFNSPGLVSWLKLVSQQQGASEIWSGLETLEIDDASVISMPFCKQLTSLTHLEFSSRGGKQGESLLTVKHEM